MPPTSRTAWPRTFTACPACVPSSPPRRRDRLGPMASGGWRIGVDIGGTFTDVALVAEDTGDLAVVKVSTTPADFGQGVVDALGEAARRHGVDAGRVSLL